MRSTYPARPDAASIARYIGIGIFIFIGILLLTTATYTVQPGYRGVEITLGKVSPNFKPEGFGFKQPFVTRIWPMSVRQQTHQMPAECYSSDLQQVKTDLYVLYRIPEHSVVKIFKEYAGAPFESLVAPRVLEALKEVAAAHNAEQIVKQREEIKQRSLQLAREKVGTNLLEIVDLVLFNITLSPELEQAIEMKMVQEQEAEKAKFLQLKAQIEAETVIIRAKGEADALEVRGQAVHNNPDFVKLQIVQNWNGRSPLVVGAGGSGANLLMSIPNPALGERTQPRGRPGQNSQNSTTLKP
ncbi:MAG TPA: prohibitin family protein [Verrucomicrobiae bacterium]|nr:prohibitin family protein [Verrucomicrobiae bacterium]